MAFVFHGKTDFGQVNPINRAGFCEGPVVVDQRGKL